MRRYAEPGAQRCYDHYRAHGSDYIRDTPHMSGAPNSPRGDGWSVAYWRGLNGVTLPDGRVPYVRGSMGWACYYAGVDNAQGAAA